MVQFLWKGIWQYLAKEYMCLSFAPAEPNLSQGHVVKIQRDI